MAYSSEVLADSPLAYLRLGDTSGTTMADSSGNARDGAYSGSPTLNAAGLLVGDGDAAVSFDGTDDKGSIPDAAWMDAPSFTVEAWVKPTSISGIRTVASRYDSWASRSFSGSSFALRLNNGKPALHIFAGNTENSFEQNALLTVGSTYHMVGTYDGATGTVRLYVNGTEVRTGTKLGMNDSSMPFTVGSTTGAERFAGTIDEVAYYGTVLSPTRIAAHYTAGTTVAEPTGTLSAVLPSLSANLAGTSMPPSVSGSIAAALPSLAADLAGETYPPGVAGDLAAVLPPLTADLSGTASAPSSTGTLDATLPPLRGNLAGQAFGVGSEGYLEAVLPALSASLSGDVLGRGGFGLVLDSSAVLTVDAPLEPEPSVPAGTPPTVLHIVAPTVPVPTLVAGRPQ